jgi:dTDP-glucose pyrophosphorylase
MPDYRKLIPDHIVYKECHLRDAVAKIDFNRCGAVCVTNNDNSLLGIITDGDVRRQLLRGVLLEDCKVEDVMQRRPVTATNDFSRRQLLHLMRSRSISQIPVVDEDNCLLGLALATDLIDAPVRGRRAVIMAGGKGIRLRPLTLYRPKPLLPLGGRPLIELIIERLVSCGFDDLIVSTGYRSDMIENQLQDGSHFGASIRYIKEKTPRGTAGCLSELPEDFEGDILVINGDILTTVNFSGMLESHQAENIDLTVAVRELTQKLEYGVVQLNDDWITSIDEKPTRKLIVSAGIYVISEELIKMIPKGAFFNMTDLIKYGLGEKRRIRSYHLREYWMDIGRMDDYQKANNDMIDLEEELTQQRIR